MFTTEDYLYGWLLYIAGGLVFFACWWWLTAKLASPALRLILRVGCLVTMYTPWYASPDLDYLAPAVVIAGVEGIFDGPAAFWRAGAPLLAALTLALILSLGFILLRHLRGSRTAGDDATGATRPNA